MFSVVSGEDIIFKSLVTILIISLVGIFVFVVDEDDSSVNEIEFSPSAQLNNSNVAQVRKSKEHKQDQPQQTVYTISTTATDTNKDQDFQREQMSDIQSGLISENGENEIEITFNLELMGDFFDGLSLPAITVDHIKRNAEIIKSGQVPADCKPRYTDSCESYFPQISEEQNQDWKEEMNEVLSYLISEYVRDKNTDLLKVVCNQLICEVLIAFNANGKLTIPVEDMHQEWSRLMAYLTDSGYLNLINLDLGIRPHGMASDIANNMYYQYFYLVFKE